MVEVDASSRIGLYLMTSKGLAVLNAAIESGLEIAHVTTAEASGMQDDSHVEIAQIAKRLQIPIFTRVHPPEFAGDWSIAAGWRWMLPHENLVVLHDSLLPKYRGFSPLITALANGDPEIGVSAFLATGDDYDAGPLVGQWSMPVAYPTRIYEVIVRLSFGYGRLASSVLDELGDTGQLRSIAQDDSQATYAIWRDENDYRIDWTQSADQVLRLINAVSYPFPGAWTTSNDKIVRIQEAATTADRPFEQRHPGKVAYHIDGDPVVICGTGMIRLLGMEDVPLRTKYV